MDSNRWKQIEALIDQALDLPPDKRINFLKEQTDDQELYKAASKFLQSIEEATKTQFMEPGSLDQGNVLSDIDSDKLSSEKKLIGTDLGKFTITEVLGRGGMATVFKGERSDKTVNQTVAIKILHSSLHSQESLIRFRMEQEILANLNHPNIAHFIDAGVTEQGNPYFIMEYVEGLPIDEYCQQKDLDNSNKLELFKQLCNAVSFAHRNLVVHRDLKPGNIYVNQDGVVKVLDFSIAKLLDPNFSDQTLIHTRQGTKLLSPTYCAPEQFQLDPITTATDVYTLGLVFYEIFSGRKALDGKNKTLKEIESRVCSGDFSSTLRLDFDSELRAIIQKATRNEPEFRYESAAQFLEDLNRYSNSLPLIAQKNSVSYRINKFIKRHSRAVVISLLVLLSSVSFITYHVREITEQRKFAESEANKATQALNLMTGIFEEASPYYHGSNDLTAEEILRRGTEYIRNESKNQPLLQATLFKSIGDIYLTLGKFQEAESLYRNALEIQQKNDRNKNEIANSYLGLGQAEIETANYDSSEYYLGKAKKLFLETEDSIGFAKAIHHQGWIEYLKGNYDKSDSLVHLSLQINKNTFGFNSKEVATDYQVLAINKFGDRKWMAADSLFGIALKIRENVFGNRHPTVVQTLTAMGDNYIQYYYVSNPDSLKMKAEKPLLRAKKISEEIFEDPHPQIGLVYYELGQLKCFRGNLDEAFSYYHKALDQFIPTYGKDHNITMNVELDIMRIHFTNGDFESVVKLLSPQIKIYEEKFGRYNPEVATRYNNLAYTFQQMGMLEEALKNYQIAFEIGKEVFDAGHPSMVQYRVNMVLLYNELGEYQKALDLTFENIRSLRENDELSYSTLEDNYYRVSRLYEKLGKPEMAKEYRLKAEVYSDSLQHKSTN